MDKETVGNNKIAILVASSESDFAAWKSDMEFHASGKFEEDTDLWEAMQPSITKTVKDGVETTQEAVISSKAQSRAYALIGMNISQALRVDIQEAKARASATVPPKNFAKAAFDALELKFMGITASQKEALDDAWHGLSYQDGVETMMEFFSRMRNLRIRLASINRTFEDAQVVTTIKRAMTGTRFQEIVEDAATTALSLGLPQPTILSMESSLQRLEMSLIKKGAKLATPALVTDGGAAGGRHTGGRHTGGRYGGGRGGRQGGGRGGGGRPAGRGQQQIACWTCGGPHKRTDCPKWLQTSEGQAYSAKHGPAPVLAAAGVGGGGRTDPNEWKWDSCSSRHITCDLDDLYDVKVLEKPDFIAGGGGEPHRITAVGRMMLETEGAGGRRHVMHFSEVCLVPTFNVKLINTRPMVNPRCRTLSTFLRMTRTWSDKSIGSGGRPRRPPHGRRGDYPSCAARPYNRVATQPWL